MQSPAVLSALTSVALLLAAGACASDEKAQTNGKVSPGSSSGEGEPRGKLVVFAAASLTDGFEALASDFEDAYPLVDIKLNFAGSQSLRTQLQNGAQAQVFASANTQHMETLLSEGLVDEPVDFVHNELVIVVPSGNPAGIMNLKDLPKAKRLVLAGENVPAGAYAIQILEHAGKDPAYGADFAARVQEKVVSRETHVRQTLQKVLLGEADAAIVYATDAASSENVETISILTEHNVVAAYPIAMIKDAPRSELGRLFIDFVLSESGNQRLTEFGFKPVHANTEEH